MSNSSSIYRRDTSKVFAIHCDKVYESGYIKKEYVPELVKVKNEIQDKHYPFDIPEVIEEKVYSYSTSYNVPKCPTCQSTNLKKISGLSKAGSVALWGIFAAGRTSKTWHCNSCGSEW